MTAFWGLRFLNLYRWDLPGPVALFALDLGAVVTRDVAEAITHRAVNEIVSHQTCSSERTSGHHADHVADHTAAHHFAAR